MARKKRKAPKLIVKTIESLYEPESSSGKLKLVIKCKPKIAPLMMEDYENMGYLVSSDGTIYSRQGKKLKTSRNNIGRGLFVSLKDNYGHESRKNVAILVANTFVPNPQGCMLVSFRDGNPENCNANNLFWITAKNKVPTRQRVYLPTKSENAGFVPPKAKRVFQYTKAGEFVREWRSIKAASIGANSHTSSIALCCNGKQKTANGYIWKFADTAETDGLIKK